MGSASLYEWAAAFGGFMLSGYGLSASTAFCLILLGLSFWRVPATARHALILFSDLPYTVLYAAIFAVPALVPQYGGKPDLLLFFWLTGIFVPQVWLLLGLSIFHIVLMSRSRYDARWIAGCSMASVVLGFAWTDATYRGFWS
jgi:hypothetical protein